MKTSLSLALSATLAISTLCGCSSGLAPLSKDNFTVTPSPLEAVGENVAFTLNGHFPEKYMKKKAVVTVIPQLRYGNGQTLNTEGATFQGEKVVGNDQVIAYKTGGNFTARQLFTYRPEMAMSELYLTFVAKVGKKSVNLPAIKVADGINATSQLVYETVRTARTATAADAYQQQITQRQEAQIKYLINQAKIRTSQLNTTSVQDFVKVLREIKADQKSFALDNIEVSAYASPDGTLGYNTQLAEQRQNTASHYVDQQLKKVKVATQVDTKYTAEDKNSWLPATSKTRRSSSASSRCTKTPRSANSKSATFPSLSANLPTRYCPSCAVPASRSTIASSVAPMPKFKRNTSPTLLS